MAAGHVPQGNSSLIRDVDKRNNIALTLEEPKVNEGWAGKAIGTKAFLCGEDLKIFSREDVSIIVGTKV